MAQGTVSRLVEDRGFGFVQGSDGVEYFFHRSGVPGGFETLQVGQSVEFAIERSEKGPRATGVKPAA